MKMKRIVSVILAVSTILANSVVLAKEYPQKFWDVAKDHWAFEAVCEFSERGVINGYEDDSFQPNKAVTRAEWAKMMIDAAGETATDNNAYFDDMENHWANKYVNAAKKYMPGTNGGYYLPDQAATREEVTASLVKICGYDKSYDYYGYLLNFTDFDTVSRVNQPYVNSAIKNNLISGFDDNTFRGGNSLTRAEAAVLLYRAFKNGKPNVETIPDTYEIRKIHFDNPTDKINISAVTKDENDNIYFVAQSKLFKMDLSGYCKEIYDMGYITLKDGEVTLSDFTTYNICYNKYTDGFVIQGSFKYADYINYDLSQGHIFMINANKESLYLGNSTPGRLVEVVAGGLIFDEGGIGGCYITPDLKNKIYIKSVYGLVDVFDAGTEFYILESTGLVRCVYSNSGINEYKMWEVGYHPGFKYIGDNIITDIKDSGEVVFYNFDGKILKSIKEDNIIKTSNCTGDKSTSSSYRGVDDVFLKNKRIDLGVHYFD